MPHHPQSTPPPRRESRAQRRRSIRKREFNNHVLDVLRDLYIMNGITRMMEEIFMLAEDPHTDAEINPISAEMITALREQYRRLDTSVCDLIELAGKLS